MGQIKDEAQSTFNRIGDGHRNAVKRPWDLRVDRSLRKMIEHANHNGDCIIPRMNGEGYYRPIPSNLTDALEYRQYMIKEHSKVCKMQEKEMCMRIAYEARKVVG